MQIPVTHGAWTEYDNVAQDMAKQGKKGEVGELLPVNMTPEAVQLIADDPEAFGRRVREHSYALAMGRAVDKEI